MRYVRDRAPEDFISLGRANANEVAHFSLALPQRNMHLLAAVLEDIANPKSPNYGKWLTKAEVMELVGTPPAIVSKVREWLTSNGEGLLSTKFTGDSILVSATVDFVERLFNTEVHYFHNFDQRFTIVRHVGELSIPSSVNEHVELVTGLTDFPPPRFRQPGKDPENGGFNPCNTPPFIRALYNMTSEDVASSGVSQAPFAQTSGNGDDGFGTISLAQFQKQCAVANNPCNRTLGSGEYSPSYTDGEANLDMEMLTTIGVGAETDFFIIDANKGWMYEYTQELMSTANPPLVNSISYGWEEDQECRNTSVPFVGKCKELHIPDSKTYVNRTNGEFMKLSSMGLTFVVASGDGGTDGGHGGYSCRYTHPIWPTNSGYVLSVGASVPVPNPNGSHPLNVSYSEPICSGKGEQSCTCPKASYEVFCSLDNYGEFDGGGGFSYFTERPSWQEDVVSSYLNSSIPLPSPAKYPGKGRGYPDVSAVGGNIAVIVQGQLSLTGGTSASAPIVAGMMSVLNDMRVKAGKSTLGFVNPLLYQAYQECPECFHDITVGYNGHNCPVHSKQGFYAAKGWDPVTGLGTINFGRLKEYVLSI